jgi:DNA repair protein RecN (Recombination protein N)
MLNYLRVENIGLIGSAAIDFSPGFTVITGETGSGKTLILGGLRLLTGEKADSGVVGPGGDQARAEGLFTDGDEEVAVSRTVPATGKSRAHLDGILVSASALEERIGPAVEIVGQHDQLSLRRPAHILALIDSAGDSQHEAAISRYHRVWEEARAAEKDLATFGGDEMTLRRELDLVTFQADEIEAARLTSDEDTELETEVSRLRNVEEITAHLAESLEILGRVSEDGGEVVARVRKVAGFDGQAATLAEQAEAAVESAQEMTRAIHRMLDGLDTDPRRLEYIEARLNTIGELKRKYGKTVAAIEEFGSKARARSEEITRLLERVGSAEASLERLKGEMKSAAGDLTAARRQVAARLSETIVGHLDDLGFDGPQVEIRFEPIDHGPTGADRVELWFASDRNLRPAKVNVGASGGELSRLVLAVRLSANQSEKATLVFDEVDTGIGGATALAMGRKLADLAGRGQVVCVTHLPQVAAYADTHYVVTRDGAAATARLVSGEARVTEISRMLAGLPDSAAGQGAAEELLGLVSSGGTKAD